MLLQKDCMLFEIWEQIVGKFLLILQNNASLEKLKCWQTSSDVIFNNL